MLSFTRHQGSRFDHIAFTPETLVIAGWAGRDEKAIHHHIEELAAIGVPPPKKKKVAAVQTEPVADAKPDEPKVDEAKAEPAPEPKKD